MKRIKHPGIMFLVILLMGSCHKIEHVSPVPSIEFTSFTIFDSLDQLGNRQKAGKLKFHFEDGDGDLGLETSLGSHPDSTKNLYLTLFKKKGGTMEPADTTDPLLPNPYYTIPYMERLGQNKVLKGTITVYFLYLFYSAEKNDTIRYDFYIEDRAKNISNTATTSEIAVSKNNIYTK